ncbi:hypothetical protein LSTR_LSTR004169 [Laodelphax striatellus]|uniref:Uncharacterized protein n=1 Tax=Laodelphax striatellus TaxID=195883 RepID=A0A482XAM6_LAOST|nr:hypothetical protein LSTR_LSTR004169 [Laodelphax striatellus]
MKNFRVSKEKAVGCRKEVVSLTLRWLVSQCLSAAGGRLTPHSVGGDAIAPHHRAMPPLSWPSGALRSVSVFTLVSIARGDARKPPRKHVQPYSRQIKVYRVFLTIIGVI